MWAKLGPKFFSFMLIQFALMCFVFQVRAADDDPPTRVAWLAYTQGSVSFQPAGTNDWVTAGLNRPMTIGDRIRSDNDGRVELQLDGSLLRLSQNTGCSFLNLSYNATQIQLTAGTLLVRVRRLDQNETYEIDTPNLAFSVLRPGLYKIAVNGNGDATVVIARSGEGEVTGGGGAYTIHTHDSYMFSGTDQLFVTRADRLAPSASQPRPQPKQPPTPSNMQPKAAEQPAERRDTPNNPPPQARNDRPATVPIHPDDNPPVARTAPSHTSSTNFQKNQQREEKQLRALQEQGRWRVERQQEQEHAQAVRQLADRVERKRMEQQHQQQIQQQKGAQEQKQLEQKQQDQQKSKKPEHPPAEQL